MKCVACGREPIKVWYNDKPFCSRCIELFGTCTMCDHSVKCEFKTNPAPIPQVVTKHVRQETPGGYMEQIVQAGQKQIREQLSTEKVAERMKKRLDEIIPD